MLQRMSGASRKAFWLVRCSVVLVASGAPTFAIAQSTTGTIAGEHSRNEGQERPNEAENTKSTYDEIVVTADGSQLRSPGEYAGGQVARGGRAGIFGNMDMMDTPFASTNFTADVALNQQSKGVGDVLLNDPAVRVARGFGNFQELYIMRGFNTFSDDMTFNGIYGILPRQFVSAEIPERVEVFRGATSFINGAAPGGSAIGGAINLVPKRADDEPLTRVTLGYEQAAHGYAAVDVGRRFGGQMSHGIRVNAAIRDGETSVEDQDRELNVLSFGYDYSGERFRLSADLAWQDNVIKSPRPSVTPSGELPEPPDADSNFAQPWTNTKEEQVFGVTRGELDIGDNVSVWAAIGGRVSEESNVLSNPTSGPDGTTSAYHFDNSREDDTLSMDLGLRAELETGPVRHRVIVSASDYSFESKNAYAFSNFAGFPGDIYDPVPVPPPPADFFTGGDLNDPLVTFTTDTRSYAIADILSFMDDRFRVIVGARHQNIETEAFNYNTGESISYYDEGRVTPIGAVLVRFGEQISVYSNYAEGLQPGETAPLISGGLPVENGGEVFDPYQSEQVEIGLKFDAVKFGGSVSAFDIAQPSGIVVDQVFSISGEQRHKGFEVMAFGEPAEGVRLVGGVTWLDATLERTQDGQFDGNRPTGVPEALVNVNAEWSVPGIENLTLDGRAVYTSSQYADAANTIEAPSWTRFDFGARYTTEIGGRQTTFRARFDNVLGSDEWISVGGYPGRNYLVLGNPRTLGITVSMDF